MAPYVRTVKTASGATAVQVVWSNKRGAKEMDHIGSAHTPEDVGLFGPERGVSGDRMAGVSAG